MMGVMRLAGAVERPAIRNTSDAQVDNAFGEDSNVMGTGIAQVTIPIPVMMGAMRPPGPVARTVLGDTSDA